MIGNPSDVMPDDPIPFRTLEQAAKTAARMNRNRAARAPLLAIIGEVEQVTAESVMADERRFRQRMDDKAARWTEKANALRSLVAAHCSPEQLAEFDGYRSRTFPPGGDYGCDYWRRMLRQVAPAVAQAHCPHAEEFRHAAMAQWYEVCPVCGLVLLEVSK